MRPEYLNELAQRADPNDLWRLHPYVQAELPAEKRKQLDTAIALRRCATHQEDLARALEKRKSLLITPSAPHVTHKTMITHWQPMSTAPWDIVALLVEPAEWREESLHDERQVFIAQRSSGESGDYWMFTVGWTGWTRMHDDWRPVAWLGLQELLSIPAVTTYSEGYIAAPQVARAEPAGGGAETNTDPDDGRNTA